MLPPQTLEINGQVRAPSYSHDFVSDCSGISVEWSEPSYASAIMNRIFEERRKAEDVPIPRFTAAFR